MGGNQGVGNLVPLDLSPDLSTASPAQIGLLHLGESVGCSAGLARSCDLQKLGFLYRVYYRQHETFYDVRRRYSNH